MARPMKKGLDYYPQDVDMFADRKIKKLLAEFGATGFMIYEFAKAQCYRENGYWVQYDDNFCFDLADSLNLGVNETFVREVILACVNRFSLFNEKVFNGLKILTSSGIQKRYLLAKKSQTIVPEIWVIDEITPVNSKITPVKPAITPVNSAESTQSKEEESKEEERREKESKENKNSFGEKKTETEEKKAEEAEEVFEVNVYENLEVFKKNALGNSLFCITICHKGISPPLLPKWLDAFHRWLIFTEDTLKSESDYRAHFARWLVRIPGYRSMNPDNYSPAKDAESPRNAFGATGAQSGLTNSEREILAKYVNA